MSEVRLPPVGPTTDIKSLSKRALAWLNEADAEQDRRNALTDAQYLAERMNFAFTREPGEAWYYEGDDWSKPEHKRWLAKAETAMAELDGRAPDEILDFLRSVR